MPLAKRRKVQEPISICRTSYLPSVTFFMMYDYAYADFLNPVMSPLENRPGFKRFPSVNATVFLLSA